MLLLLLAMISVILFGPFYGAIAVPSVTRCRCCRRLCCGHRCVETHGEWQCGVRRLALANGPNIFQMLLVFKIISSVIFNYVLWALAL